MVEVTSFSQPKETAGVGDWKTQVLLAVLIDKTIGNGAPEGAGLNVGGGLQGEAGGTRRP